MSTAATANDFSLFDTGSWSLTKAFKAVAHTVTIGVVAAVAWQVFLDPIFFPILHDTTNVTAQAWVTMINQTFSFIPDALGFTGDWGLLQTDFMQAILDPSIELNAIPGLAEVNASSGGMEAMSGSTDLDALLEYNPG